MGEKLSIKLHIANRIYPMKIERKSEEYIRNAVKKGVKQNRKRKTRFRKGFRGYADKSDQQQLL